MSNNLIYRLAIVLVIGCALALMAQESNAVLPTVAKAAVPLYPPLARVARVEGVVHLKVTTDGHRVIAAHVEDGHKMLAAAAEENARTWEFATHEPTTFIVRYRYKIDAKLKGGSSNPTVVLRFPSEVEISICPPPPLDTTGMVGTSTTH